MVVFVDHSRDDTLSADGSQVGQPNLRGATDTPSSGYPARLQEHPDPDQDRPARVPARTSVSLPWDTSRITFKACQPADQS